MKGAVVVTLGDYIRQYRKEHGISQRKFAAMTGLTNTYISNLEHGTNPNGVVIIPSVDTYKRVAVATGIDAGQLVTIVEDNIELNPLFSPQEQSMMLLFRKASDRDKKLIMSILAEYDQ